MPRPAPILIVPDSFKGTFAAPEVAAAIARGVRAAGREAVELPAADGGEGTAAMLLAALGGEWRTTTVSGPLGVPVEARWALLDGGVAVVEAASASGMVLLGESELDPWKATTRGSASSSPLQPRRGRAACWWAAAGRRPWTAGQARWRRSRKPGAGGGGWGAEGSELIAICDARTPWEECARLFGPQKGARTPAAVRRLERRLAELAAGLPKDPRGLAFSGCGGGLSGGLWSALGAELAPGASYVLDSLGFDPRMKASQFVITGEGRLDPQTLEGKLAGEVATRCRQAGVWCHAVVGSRELDQFRVRVLDFASVTEAGDVAAFEAAGRALANA